MTTRSPARRLPGLIGAGAVALALLAGCGSSGPTAETVVDDMSAVFPLPNPRDNTESCAGTGGCEQLITTDGASVYQWPDEATAVRHAETAGGMGQNVEQAGVFTLRLQDDYPSSDEAKAAWAERFRAAATAGA